MICRRPRISEALPGADRRTAVEQYELAGRILVFFVRHRTVRSKGCLSNKTALALVFKLVEGAQKTWRRIDGHNQLPKLILGVKFTDGIEVIGNSAAPQAAA